MRQRGAAPGWGVLLQRDGKLPRDARGIDVQPGVPFGIDPVHVQTLALCAPFLHAKNQAMVSKELVNSCCCVAFNQSIGGVSNKRGDSAWRSDLSLDGPVMSRAEGRGM